MPMETPQGISRRVPPSSFHSGCCLLLASASQSAFSRAALAMRWPRTRASRAGSFPCPASGFCPISTGSQVMGERRPGALDPFAAVKGVFPDNAFTPAIHAFAMHGDEQDAAAVDAAKTRLEEMDEWHLDFAQGDGFDFHVNSVQGCKVAQNSTLLSALHDSVDQIISVLTHMTSSRPSEPNKNRRCLSVALVAQSRRSLGRKRLRNLLAVALLHLLGTWRACRPPPSTRRSAPGPQTLSTLKSRDSFPCEQGLDALRLEPPFGNQAIGGQTSLQGRRGDAILVDVVAAGDGSQLFDVEIGVLDFQRIEGPLDQLESAGDARLRAATA